MDQDAIDFITPIREFLDRRLPTEKRRALLSAGGWDPGLMAELTELGWCELSRPEIRGGLGVPPAALRGLAELVGERLVPGPLTEQLVLPALLDLPTTGLVAFADPRVTEDWASEMGGLRLRAGRLTGRVELVRHAAQARQLVLAVDPDPDGSKESAAIIVLPAADPALTIEDLPSADPTSHYARLVVHDRQIAGSELLATGAEAVALLTRIRAWTRIFTACELAGIARQVLADSVEYAKRREQFGRPIGSFQAVKQLLAGMAHAALSLEALCEATAADATDQDLADLKVAGWTVKAYAARAAGKVCEDGLQVHGGIGFTIEYDLHWYLRRALALRTWYGDEHELTALLGAYRMSPKLTA